MLPSFDLDTPSNVEAWESIRRFLMKYDEKAFKRAQRHMGLVLCFVVILTVLMLIGYLGIGHNVLTHMLVQRSFSPSSHIGTPVIRIVVLYVLLVALVLHIVYNGFQTARLHESQLVHILKMKRAELTGLQGWINDRHSSSRTSKLNHHQVCV
jgi:hypothetical protein